MASNDYSLPGVERGDQCMMKIGDRFKDERTGKIYTVKMEIDNERLRLEGGNGLDRRLTSKESLKQTCDKLQDIAS